MVYTGTSTDSTANTYQLETLLAAFDTVEAGLSALEAADSRLSTPATVDVAGEHAAVLRRGWYTW